MADYLSRWTGQEIDDRLGIVRGRNLFDNPWFTVVQRDYATVTGIAYNADRWIGTQSTTVTTSSAAGLEVTGYVEQRFDDDLRDFLAGKTVTLSVMMADGTIHSGSAVVPAVGGSQVNVFSFAPIYGYIGYNTNTLRVRLRSNGVASTFRAAKLEIGEVSTLANDVPPNNAEELAKCQRYFVRIANKTSGNSLLAPGVVQSGNVCIFSVPVPVPMRANPSVTQNNLTVLLSNGAVLGFPNVMSVSSIRNNVSSVQVSVTHDGSSTIGTAAFLRGDVNSYLDISADL